MRTRTIADSRRVLAACVVGMLVAAGCSESTADKASTTSTTPGSQPRPECTQGPTIDPVVSEPVAEAPADRTITSFDGTHIRAHWFPAPGASASEPHPTVLMGPGWSLPGQTLAKPSDLFEGIGIESLNDRGYNVLTWDPRGFGKSDGIVQINSPDFEGRDVQVLIDWVATQQGVKLDRVGDPRVGMIGGSYGGGIQFVTASQDCRVDAIVPTIAWHSLETSLYKAQTLKAGWANLLKNAAVAAGGELDPHITSAAEAGTANVTISDEDLDWFRGRGPGDLVEKVSVPTLIIQGTVDTLFTLDEAITNYRALRDDGVTVAMMWWCGGHGTCISTKADSDRTDAATFAWLDEYLGDDPSDLPVPRIQIVDQDGRWWTADDYPQSLDAPLTASGSGGLQLTAESVAGPATPRPDDPDALSGIVPGITPAKAAIATEVKVSSTSDALIVGAPRVQLTYSGTAPSGTRPTRVFAQLVDDSTGLVLGNQITPIDVILDGATHEVSSDLEVVAHHLMPGKAVTLQLVATTDAYAQPRMGGSITFASIKVDLPVSKGFSQATG